MAVTIMITYDDGSTVDVKTKAVDQHRAEMRYGIDPERQIDATYKTALTALLRLGHEPAGTNFEEWLGRVDQVEPAEESETGPTSEAAPPAASSSSASPRGSRSSSSRKKTSGS